VGFLPGVSWVNVGVAKSRWSEGGNNLRIISPGNGGNLLSCNKAFRRETIQAIAPRLQVGCFAIEPEPAAKVSLGQRVDAKYCSSSSPSVNPPGIPGVQRRWRMTLLIWPCAIVLPF
jgi:hypothetical protein